MKIKQNKLATLSLSGGMDSSGLLIHLLANDYKVKAISFDYGQKHYMELDRAKALVEYLIANGLSDQVSHTVVKLDGLQELLHSSLVLGGTDVPEGHYEDENMKATVVPNRNKMFSSIIQAAALSMSEKAGGEEVHIAMGIHAGDHAIYPDCRQAFRDADYNAFIEGNMISALKVKFYTPYLDVTKLDILKDCKESCKALNIDFGEVLARTNTCYNPNEKGESCGKCGSCQERLAAFNELGIKDLVPYSTNYNELVKNMLAAEEDYQNSLKNK
jgi:7-cyano-7-deazaguanine synthase